MVRTGPGPPTGGLVMVNELMMVMTGRPCSTWRLAQGIVAGNHGYRGYACPGVLKLCEWFVFIFFFYLYCFFVVLSFVILDDDG